MDVVLAFVLGVANQIWKAFILALVWGWFVAPKFGLPRLSVVDAAGVSIFANFVLSDLLLATVWTKVDEKFGADDNKKVLMRSVATGAFVYPLALLGAYIWHQFQ